MTCLREDYDVKYIFHLRVNTKYYYYFNMTLNFEIIIFIMSFCIVLLVLNIYQLNNFFVFKND